MNNIIQFPKPEQPENFIDDLITAVQDNANTALCEAAGQLEALQLAAEFEKDGDAGRAQDLRALADGNAWQVIEDYIASLRSLADLQFAVLHLLGLIGESASERRTALADWTAEKPAIQLVTTCREIAASLGLPPASDLRIEVSINGEILGSSAMRANARQRGTDAAVLEEIIRLSDLGQNNAA